MKEQGFVVDLCHDGDEGYSLASQGSYDFDPQTNVVDVYIRRVRGKIDRPDESSLIEAVRGVGYRFRAVL